MKIPNSTTSGYPLPAAVAASLLCLTTGANAVKLDAGPDWAVNLDTSLQYTLGTRAQSRNNNIGNHPFFAEGDYKFDRGDLVTNRAQGIVEFQGVYKDNAGFRLSGSAWYDAAYNDEVRTNPAPGYSSFLSYTGGKYSSTTKKYHLRGGELLDAFVFGNTSVGDTKLYGKLGRFTQHWGNAFLFGFSNIAYSQHPIDFIKGFSQPGSEVKELFLPRAQVLATAELSPELSVSGQYFLEFRPNRYPEGGTYLGPFDILYYGPNSGGALAGLFGGPVVAGVRDEPKNKNKNFGLKLTWSPQWAGGDLGFYYRQLDEVHPWPLVNVGAAGGGALHLSYPQKVKLYGVSYERTFGPISTGFEASYRKNSGLNSALTNGIPGSTTSEGAKGNLVNLIANAFVQLGTTPLWDTGTLIAEASYTQLTSVTSNARLFNGVGYPGCPSGSKWEGCATKRSLALGFAFEPQWLQVFPGWDLSMPISLTLGVNGNPAYAAGSFYAQGANIHSIGIRGTFQSKSTITLQYNGYHWRHNRATFDPALGQTYYPGFGGNGAVALNDKGWIQLTFKTSF
ncbi:hypothetical protein C7T35_31970 [Variovorax sp. WS11]|uniref:DUF1302 domain-containing protein n=1 Tax=Variovorax sp. WS11 TaxID=1105204 RepID=UPI000D0E2D81|nr:DUF1302 family protein [Variovorax sp. WS11]NDZ17744.1 DUF1302 domain-containing protein [Variovorax sp. WS11]PSL80453.1 hypothetical protein C7T35_31970 [Variovorax sp. WS11]